LACARDPLQRQRAWHCTTALHREDSEYCLHCAYEKGLLSPRPTGLLAGLLADILAGAIWQHGALSSLGVQAGRALLEAWGIWSSINVNGIRIIPLCRVSACGSRSTSPAHSIPQVHGVNACTTSHEEEHLLCTEQEGRTDLRRQAA
jgi:hypothetical protein